MCKTQCLLALVALYVGLVQSWSWDIAVGVEDRLIFYLNGTKTNTVNLISRNLTALAYDEVNNRMLYVDNKTDNAAICGINLHSNETECFIERNGRSNIQSIAFDPATQTLFFTDANDSSINWISLKPESVNNVYGNLLIKMDDRTPSDIAVDSCTGYIYWTNTNNEQKYNESMERARFNGSGREIIKRKFKSYAVLTMVIDPLTRKMYYFDGFTYGGLYDYEYLNHAGLNGQDEKNIYKYNYNEYGHYSAAKELTVSEDYLYWVYTNESYNTVWQLPKNAILDLNEPNKISSFYAGPWYNEIPLAIATNYKIKDQIQGLQDCEALSSLLPTITVTNNSLNIEQTTEYTTDVDLFCVHGVHVSETSVCICTPGYIGERCEVSVCHNYCLQGNCSLTDEGLPACRCNTGYSGKRCEVYACAGYCLNDGACSLNEQDEPVCQCAANHEGSRCEAVKDVSFTINNTPTYYSAERNLTLADLLANWRKPSAKVTVTVEV